MLAPAALSLLSTTFTEAKERATAFAVFGGIAGSGAAIGMLLGGVLTEYLNWRWTLFVNVAISVVAIAGAATLIPRQPKAATGRGSTCPARCWSPRACSASSTASPTPSRTRGALRAPGASWPAASC